MGNMRSVQACRNKDYVVCVKNEAGAYAWTTASSVGADHPDCPEDSLPMHLHAHCHGYDGCYEKEGDAYCVQAIDPSAPQNASAHHPGTGAVSHDRPKTRHEISRGFEACVVQPYEFASNTALIGYVPKGSADGCRRMTEDLRKQCTTSECNATIIPVFDSDADTPGCVVDHLTMPIAHKDDDREWFRWVRENFHTCKDAGGWMCAHDDGVPHTAPTCKHDTDCERRVAHGVCDRDSGKCSIGTSKGGQCRQDEHCDVTDLESQSKGKCDAGHCIAGNTGVEPIYHIPKRCDLPDKTNDTRAMLHNFCGETRDANSSLTIYNGVCAEYEFGHQTFGGCRAFSSEREADDYRKEEEAWQARPHRKHHNFAADANSEPWTNLAYCADRIVKDGRMLCATTVDSIAAYTPDTPCDHIIPHAPRQGGVRGPSAH